MHTKHIPVVGAALSIFLGVIAIVIWTEMVELPPPPGVAEHELFLSLCVYVLGPVGVLFTPVACVYAFRLYRGVGRLALLGLNVAGLLAALTVAWAALAGAVMNGIDLGPG